MIVIAEATPPPWRPVRSQKNFPVDPSMARVDMLASGLLHPVTDTYASVSKILATSFRVGAYEGAAVVGETVGDKEGVLEGLLVGLAVGV